MMLVALLPLVGSALVGVGPSRLPRRAHARAAAGVSAAASAQHLVRPSSGGSRPDAPEVIVAGGGIGGLCTALVMLKMGYSVRVFEKTSRYRPFGGPIQIASNAAESIRRIDEAVYEKILSRATVIGDRTNGLKDGQSDEWFATFDLDSPARKRGQVSSVVIDRPVLQEILLEKVGHCVTKGSEVVACEQVGDRVRVLLSTNATAEGDLLVGSDGINSRVRDLFDPTRREPVWSGYTCVAGMAYCTPSDIAEVGYKVWVGPRKYFVSVDVGGGRIQWYAFLNLPPGSLAPELRTGQPAIDFMKGEFEGWSDEVFQLLDNTPVDEIEQRDLYDRPPQLTWSSGRVCLLGDAAHPMMPNLGQGGCMAIEDAFVLGRELRRVGDDSESIPLALKRYNQNRVLRAAAVQGMSRLSSAILFQYNHPLELEWAMPPRLKNTAPKSVITRMGQGFLQRAAFPLQFEFLFDFPGQLAETPGVEGFSPLERALMMVEKAATAVQEKSPSLN